MSMWDWKSWVAPLDVSRTSVWLYWLSHWGLLTSLWAVVVDVGHTLPVSHGSWPFSKCHPCIFQDNIQGRGQDNCWGGFCFVFRGFIFLKDRVTREKKQKEKEVFCLLVHSGIAGAGPGQNRDPGTPSWSLLWWQGPKCSGHLLQLSKHFSSELV